MLNDSRHVAQYAAKNLNKICYTDFTLHQFKEHVLPRVLLQSGQMVQARSSMCVIMCYGD